MGSSSFPPSPSPPEPSSLPVSVAASSSPASSSSSSSSSSSPSPAASAAVASSATTSGWRRFVALKASTEYDSEEAIFVNKISARILDGFAKIKASFQREQTGETHPPTLSLSTKHLSVIYDCVDQNALVTAIANVGSNVEIKYLRDIKAQQGEVKLIARSSNSKYQAEIGYAIPVLGLPRASLNFPNGELRVEEEQRDEGTVLSINGFIGTRFLNGLALAEYRDDQLGLKYKYKDAEMMICPSVSLPSKSLSLAFKRQFDQYNKLSYLYNFDSAAWSAVYKHRATENFKFKAGYDSTVRVGWAGAWVGREESGAKKAPKKCKLQVMLQVPQDDVKSAAILFKVKKRWDI